MRLSEYNYTCVHIKGAENVWADLLGRWSAPARIRRIFQVPVLPSSSSSDFEWPSREIVRNAQSEIDASKPPNITLSDGLWRDSINSTWIPDESTDLQLRLCFIAHRAPSGHRGSKSTEKSLRKEFFWSTLSEDVNTFVNSCIHCLSTTGGRKNTTSIWPCFSRHVEKRSPAIRLYRNRPKCNRREVYSNAS